MLKTLLSFIPTKLPIGRTAMDKWSKEIIQLAGVPDNSSTRFALGVMIMHRPPHESAKSKRFFAKQLYKAAVNEVAHTLISEIKEQQQKEAETQKKAAATALLEQVADGAKLPEIASEMVCEAQ